MRRLINAINWSEAFFWLYLLLVIAIAAGLYIEHVATLEVLK